MYNKIVSVKSVSNIGEISPAMLIQSKQIPVLHRNVFDVLFYVMIISLIGWYLQYHWKRRKLYETASKTNGPFALPFIGNALNFIGSNSDILKSIMSIAENYESPARVWLGQKLVFIISKPQQLETVLNSTHALEKEELYKFADIMVSTGLLTAPVPKWRRHRKIILPTFNQKILDGFVEIFSEQSQILVEQLEKIAGKGTFNIFHYVSRCTLDIICETAMGITVNAQTTDSDYVKWANKAMEIIFTRIFFIWYHSEFIFSRTSMAKEIRDVTSKMRAFTGSVVKEKRIAYQKKMKESKDRPEALLEEESKTRKTFLQKLVELSEEGAHFTDEELREEVDTFMLAGSDTTATTNSFVFLVFGMFPSIQEKVYQEVLDVLGPEKYPEPKDLANLVYLERVIKETLRVFPVGPFIVRSVTADIKIDDCTIPAGSSVLALIMRVHRDPKIWPEPTRFDPDRFLPEAVSKRHPYSWLPFSGGPRNCVGPKYAMMAMKSLIATVVRKYRFSAEYKTVEEIKLKNDLVLKPVDGYRVSIELRE